MSDTNSTRSVIIVGVHPGQPDDVLLQAMRFAERLDAELVCATVSEPLPVVTAPVLIGAETEVDIVGSSEEFEPDFADHLIHLLSRSEVPRSLRKLSGDPAQELGRLAEELNAKLIIVGTRQTGLRASAHEFFTGSVAVHLAHRQHRPVAIIPLSPVPHGTKLPWEEP